MAKKKGKFIYGWRRPDDPSLGSVYVFTTRLNGKDTDPVDLGVFGEGTHHARLLELTKIKNGIRLTLVKEPLKKETK